MNDADYCIICGERKVYCRCSDRERKTPGAPFRITTPQQARDFVADMIITYAERGPEAANSMMHALGRSELQIAFSEMFVRYLQMAVREQKANQENSKEY